jgi:Protein of unknown function (DUF2599)
MPATGRRLLIVAVVVAVAAAVAILLTLNRHGHDSPSASPGTAGHHTAAPTTPAPAITQPLIVAAHWQPTSQGYRLHVSPSRYGRNHAIDSPPLALAEAIRAAQPTPFHISPTIRHALTDQLRCHAEFAPTKAQWDLESWRPDVGYLATVEALCNP